MAASLVAQGRISLDGRRVGVKPALRSNGAAAAVSHAASIPPDAARRSAALPTAQATLPAAPHATSAGRPGWLPPPTQYMRAAGSALGAGGSHKDELVSAMATGDVPLLRSALAASHLRGDTEPSMVAGARALLAELSLGFGHALLNSAAPAAAGMKGAAAAAAGPLARGLPQSADRECVVCLDAEPAFAFLPCGHRCACPTACLAARPPTRPARTLSCWPHASAAPAHASLGHRLPPSMRAWFAASALLHHPPCLIPCLERCFWRRMLPAAAAGTAAMATATATLFFSAGACARLAGRRSWAYRPAGHARHAARPARAAIASTPDGRWRGVFALWAVAAML